MKKLITIISTLICISNYAQTINWAQHGKGPQNTYGDGITNDANGNIYVTGDFRDSIRFGNLKITESSFGSPYTVKLDSLGNPIWLIKDIGGDGIVFDGASNLYAYTQNNQTIKKINVNGNVIWTKQTFTSTTFGSNGINGLYATANFVYVTGHYSGDAKFDNDTIYNTTPNNGNWDIFVAKFNANNGVNVWAKTAGGKGVDKGYGIYVNTSGDIYNTGYYRDTATFATTTFTSNGLQDAYVSKYDLNGNLQWAKSYGSSGFDLSNDITQDASGNLYAMGRFSNSIAFGTNTITGGSVNSFITKFDSNGIPLWAKAIAGNEEGDISYSNNKLAFIVSSNNGIALDSYSQTAIGGTDILVGELNTNGTTLWAKLYGGTENEEGSGILQRNGSIYFTGSFNQTANFDSFSFTSMQSWDAVIAKINVIATELIEFLTNPNIITIYPNPVNNSQNIFFSNLNQEVKITILNYNGQVVLSAKNKSNSFSIDGLNPGLYIVQVIEKEKTIKTAKLVIQ